MLVFEWETARFEVVVEQHNTPSSLQVERRPGEIIIDLGKFSCAATIRPAKVTPRYSMGCAFASAILAITAGVLLGVGMAGAEACGLNLTPAALQPFTSG